MLGNAGKHVIISSFQSINFTWATSILILTREWIAMLVDLWISQSHIHVSNQARTYKVNKVDITK